MNIPTTIIPVKRRVRRKRRGATTTPPVAPLMLVGAAYDPGGLTVTLVFNRAINVDALDGSRISVDSQVEGNLFLAEGAVELIDAQSVQIGLVYESPTSGTQVLLNAEAGNGIVAVDDGAAWAGVTNYALG